MAAKIAPQRLIPAAATAAVRVSAARIAAAFLAAAFLAAACIAAAACLAGPEPLLATQPDPQPAADPAADGRGWSAGLWMGYGYQWPNGRLANNSASDNPNLRLLEVVSDLSPSPVAAGGVEVRFPGRGLAVRLGWAEARGTEASGQVIACGLFTGPLCEPVKASARIRTYSSVARLLTGNPASAIRPVLSGGVGVRTFDYDLPECPRLSTEDLSLICNTVRDMYLDPGPHFLLRAGAGIQAGVGRIAVAADAYATTGQYRGGGGRTDGNWYHTLRAELSLGAALF